MVMLTIHKLRAAIAMIELIFAIVIMGIILLSAPMLITQSTKSNTVVFQQESISILASHTGALMTYFWDEANVGDNAILTTNGNAYLDGQTTRLVASKQRRPDPLLGAVTVMGTETDAFGPTGTNDVDDFHGVRTTLSLGLGSAAAGAVNEGEYVDTSISIDTVVSYGKDDGPDGASTAISFSNPFSTFAGTTSNIKRIQATLGTTATATELSKTIVLTAFMCNIGGVTLDSRHMP